jgi:alpha/beta superfamily hydrolase
MRIDFTDTVVGTFNYELVRTLNGLSSGGAELGEAIGIAQAIPDGDFDGWERAWTRAADRLTALAHAALAHDHACTARSQLLRASNYYRAAAFYVEPGTPVHRTLWDRSRSTFEQAGPLLDPPVEAVDIPFGDGVLPGYFVRAAIAPAPTLIVHGGFDSTMEELYHWIAAAAVERGWNCLCFEGPGQWAALYRTGATFRPDWEVPVAAAVDWVLARPEVAAGSIALIGYSFGGNLAPRAAAAEPRLAACVANSLLVDLGQSIRMPELPDRELEAALAAAMRDNLAVRWFVQHGRWACGIDSPAELFPVPAHLRHHRARPADRLPAAQCGRRGRDRHRHHRHADPGVPFQHPASVHPSVPPRRRGPGRHPLPGGHDATGARGHPGLARRRLRRARTPARRSRRAASRGRRGRTPEPGQGHPHQAP